MTIAVPWVMSGVTRFEKPYECDRGMAAKLMSFGAICIVAQMLWQSARRLASEVTIPFGLPLEPDVSLISRAFDGIAGRSRTARVEI